MLVIITVAALIFSGVIYIGSKTPQEQAYNKICKDEIVKSYNDTRNGKDASKNALSNLAKSIEAKQNYEKDSTCLYILYKASEEQYNSREMENYLLKLKDNYKKGIYINNNLDGVSGIDSLERSLELFKDMLEDAKTEDNNTIGVG